MISEAENQVSIITDFDKVNEGLSKSKPSWLNELRMAGLNRFTAIGFPTVKDEEWKYTNIAPITKKKYKFRDTGKIIETDAFQRYVKKNEISLVFLNGTFSTEHSNLKSLPKGIQILPLDEAFTKEEVLLKKLLSKYKPEEETPFMALNRTLLDSVILIKVNKNTHSKELIHIVHVTSGIKKELITAPRTLIALDQSSEITILESYLAFSDEYSYFSTPLTDIFLEENATLHYCKAQKESLKAYHVGNTRVWQERNSILDSVSFMTGGHITRNNLDIILNGEGADTTLNGLYSLYSDQHADNHTCVDHRTPNCTSNQLYKGILNEAARAVFNGKIFVQPVAQQTNSYQLNKNLLLGKDCRVDTKPQLEIFADDVKCTHGATIGQLNEDEIFYLQTRCIPREAAVKMLAKGFVDDLLNHLQSDVINQKLHVLLEPSFAKL